MNLTNYTPKGDLKGLPIEVIKQMLIEQVAQGNKEDVTVFEVFILSDKLQGGFNWNETKLDIGGWKKAIVYKDFTQFYKMYPKEEEEDFTKEYLVKIAFEAGQEMPNIKYKAEDYIEHLKEVGILKSLTNPYPKMMWVWDEEGHKPFKDLIEGKFQDKYLSWCNTDRVYIAWNFAKDIEENAG